MRFINACVPFATVALLLLAPARGADKDKKYIDKWVGARWEFQTVDKGDRVEGKFRATADGKVYHGDDQIGTWSSKDEDECTVEITEKKCKLAGKMTFTQTKKDPPKFRGEWNPPGSGKKDKREVTLELIHN